MIYVMTFTINFLKRYLLYVFLRRENGEDKLIRRQKKLDKIVSFACNNSKFYRKLYDSKSTLKDVNIENLPVINKSVLIENFDEIITSKFINKSELHKYFKYPFSFNRKFMKKYLAFHTSGSTGNTAYVVWGPREFAIATVILLTKNTQLFTGEKLSELLFRRKKFLYFGIMDDYVGGNSWVYGMRFLTKLKMLSIFSPIEKQCKELNEFQPDVIMAKPHLLGKLANQQKLGNLKINPEKIIFVGEMLMPHDKELIETYFGYKPSNSYSTCETGPVAFQSDDVEGLDIIEDEVWVELLDEFDNPIREYYKPGRIVITNLYNKIMPIIRYDIGDSACYIPGKKAGHFNRISYIQGRQTSSFIFENMDGTQVKISEFPFWSLFVPGIARYQVIQNSKRSIHLKIEWDKEFRDFNVAQKQVEKKVKRIFEEHKGLTDIELTFEYMEKILPNSVGKIKITFPLEIVQKVV